MVTDNLDPEATETLFTVEGDTLRLVARFATPGVVGNDPTETWGALAVVCAPTAE